MKESLEVPGPEKVIKHGKVPVSVSVEQDSTKKPSRISEGPRGGKRFRPSPTQCHTASDLRPAEERENRAYQIGNLRANYGPRSMVEAHPDEWTNLTNGKARLYGIWSPMWMMSWQNIRISREILEQTEIMTKGKFLLGISIKLSKIFWTSLRSSFLLCISKKVAWSFPNEDVSKLSNDNSWLLWFHNILCVPFIYYLISNNLYSISSSMLKLF